VRYQHKALAMNEIQFFLKCQNVETGEVVTYRFANQQQLIAFSKHLAARKLTIVDTHIGFYDLDVLFNPFFDNVSPINPIEINTAITPVLD
jgi:hypothetical protein